MGAGRFISTAVVLPGGQHAEFGADALPEKASLGLIAKVMNMNARS